MPSRLNYLLDHYRSPKIIGGRYASPASAPSRARLSADPEYQALREQLVRIGFFAPARGAYAWRMAAFASLHVALFAYLMTAPGPLARIAALIAIGMTHTLCNFLGHDLAHGAVSQRRAVTEVAGQLFDSLLTGFSFTYFRRSHTLHHYHCNEEDFDPDTISILWSVNEHGVRTKRGFSRRMTRIQHVAIPILYLFWAVALKLQGIAYALRNPREAAADLAMIALHLAIWFTLGTHYLGFTAAAIDYLAMTIVVGAYLGVIFPVNHVAMSYLDAERAGACSFLRHQLVTTRNVTSSPLRDLLFMGLNSQIEHHLFPYAPSMHLAAARPVVRQFCAERGLPYEECGHLAAHVDITRHLKRMATR